MRQSLQRKAAAFDPVAELERFRLPPRSLYGGNQPYGGDEGGGGLGGILPLILSLLPQFLPHLRAMFSGAGAGRSTPAQQASRPAQPVAARAPGPDPVSPTGGTLPNAMINAMSGGNAADFAASMTSPFITAAPSWMGGTGGRFGNWGFSPTNFAISSALFGPNAALSGIPRQLARIPAVARAVPGLSRMANMQGVIPRVWQGARAIMGRGAGAAAAAPAAGAGGLGAASAVLPAYGAYTAMQLPVAAFEHARGYRLGESPDQARNLVLERDNAQLANTGFLGYLKNVGQNLYSPADSMMSMFSSTANAIRNPRQFNQMAANTIRGWYDPKSLTAPTAPASQAKYRHSRWPTSPSLNKPAAPNTLTGNQ